jgi:enoyl-CoA hydratase/carnithine racemase
MVYQREGKVGYLRFNRPQSLNAVNDQFEQDLQDALLEFDIDEAAWVCIIHGAGRCFCAGADIKQRFVNMTPQQQARRTRGSSPEGYLGRSINWKPVIAAVHGYALGAGMAIAAECDLIVASEDAQFGITETKRGLPGGRVWAKVSAFMPSKIATEMLITGEPVGAPELYRLGLINRLVPPGNHLEVAEELAEKVLKAPPLAARAGVRLTRRPWVPVAADADLYIQPLKLHLTQDFQEASRSFVEKRPPEYRAR